MFKFEKNRLISFGVIVLIAAASFVGNTSLCLAETLVDSISMERVSVSHNGDAGNADSHVSDISMNGRYIAFASTADNLTANDGNGRGDVFLYDRQSADTTLISVDSSGGQGNNHSGAPKISEDGRYVAFESNADNLVPGDTNGITDIFVRDRQTNTTMRVNVATNGSQANSFSTLCDISSDGRYVVYFSSATNLVAGDTNLSYDIFLYDMATGTTSRISGPMGQGVSGSEKPSISADGRYVVFESDAWNFVAGDTNGVRDVFRYDIQTDEILRVSTATDGTQANSQCNNSRVSEDGRYVIFNSGATNLVSNDTNGIDDLFIHDMLTGETTLASVASDGTQGNGNCTLGDISSNGRYAVFQSDSTNLIPDGTNGRYHIFLHDFQTGKTALISKAESGIQGDDESLRPRISSDGSCIVFESNAENLVVNDINNCYDIFVSTLGVIDGDAPTWPAGSLSATNITQNSLTLSWTAAADMIGVTGYKIYQDGVLCTTTAISTTSYNVTGLAAGTSYTFKTEAGDAAGNWSINGPQLAISTASTTQNAPADHSSNSSQDQMITTDKTKVTITPSINRGSDIASASLTASILDRAYGLAQPDPEGIKTVQIRMPEAEGGTDYEVMLPSEFLTSKDGTRTISIVTELATIILPSNMLSSDDKNLKTISLTVGSVDKNALPESVREQIGRRPIIELNLKTDGKQIYWQNDTAPVTISIPYTPTAEELANPEHITVWYLDSEGNAVPVTSGRYDPNTHMVTFTAVHFSQYAIVYVQKEFRDLKDVKWAELQINALAAKGIIKGTSDSEFSPQRNITRGDYIALLIRTLGLNSEFKTNFVDVEPTDYYYKEIGIAKELGVAAGSPDNCFRSRDYISRQDMMVLTERALRMIGKTDQADITDSLNQFEDKDQISAYAIKSVSEVVQEGLIEGNGARINPRAYLTRAEAAVVLYRIYHN